MRPQPELLNYLGYSWVDRGLYLQTVPGHGGTLTRRWAVAEFSPDFRW